MLLGFQRRFEPYVLDGSKTHSIRALRKRPFKVGDRIDCYGDVRQKTMHLLGRFTCVDVQRIFIYSGGSITIDGVDLSADEIEALAWRDGFRPSAGSSVTAAALMLRFWRSRLQAGRWVGQIIHWRYDRKAVAA